MNQDEDFAAPAIHIIQERWPSVWSELEAAPDYPGIELIQGNPSVTLKAGGIQLASAYEPLAEARLQMADLSRESRRLCLYGVGMGYLPRLLLNELPGDAQLQVVPLNRALFKELLYWIDQSDWLADERIQLLLPTPDTRPEPPYILTPPCLWLADEAGSSLRDRLLVNLNQDNAEQSLEQQANIFSDNMSQNEPLLESDGDAEELFGKLPPSNNGAVVIAAGPSLNSELAAVRRLQASGRIVIAVDAALRTLLAGGVLPSIVVTLDHKPTISRFFDADLNPMRDSTLVYFPVVDNAVLTAWPHRRLAAYTSNRRYDELRRRCPKATLYASGTVLHPAVDLAVQMGAKEIHLAGADFSFPDARTHAVGVFDAHRLEPDALRERTAHWVINGHDERVPSIVNLIGYLRDLEDYIRSRPDVDFVNLSRKGARITGARYPEETR